MSDKKLRSIKSFVMRSGRLKDCHKQAIENYKKIFGLEYIETNKFDFYEIFKNNNPVVLEIGFGMGTSLATMAENNPDINYLGIEVHTAGIGNILSLIAENQLKNIKVIQHDAIDILVNNISDNSLQGIQIFFPDPWHKKRHHKRRLVKSSFLNIIIPKIKTAGFLHLATDWENYAYESLELFNETEALENEFELFSDSTENRPKTKFEIRGEKLGHKIFDIVFKKV